MFLLMLFVAGISFGESHLCLKPGVYPLESGPDRFLVCKYNEEGVLVSQILPCQPGKEYSPSSGICVDTFLIRRTRGLLDSKDSSESKESESSNESNLSADSKESTENMVETTESFVTELTQADIIGTTGANITQVPSKDSKATTLVPITSTSGGTGTNITTQVPTKASEATTLVPITSTSGPIEQIECRFPGIMCTSCSQAALCVGTGTMKNNIPYIAAVATVECLQNQICADLIGCVSDQNQLCTLGRFVCTDEGMFPDPYDCKIFHSCVLLNGIFKQDDITCMDGAYGSKTGTCGYPLNSPTCVNKPVPHCRAQFEMGAIPSNPNIYYICIKKGNTLTPSLFKCPAGLKFTTALFSCV